MSGSCDLKEIVTMLLDFRGEKIREFCRRGITAGIDPLDIFNDLSRGLEEIGRGYENRDFRRYFTADLIVSGRNMKIALDLLKPCIPAKKGDQGQVIVGTVEGDIHDIGKTIFAITLESHGFSVVDLGVNVSPHRFIEGVREYHPDVLSMSALLSTTVFIMRDVIRELEKEGLRDTIKVIIGGRAVSEPFAEEIGADAYGRDCIDGLRKCQAFMRIMP